MAKATAKDMAAMQKEISVSEFFEKNKHLLGFDNPTKALLMSVKEGVDNSLDACEEAGILPDLKIKIKNVRGDIYQVTVEDNGPGIVKKHIPKIFGKLLYGSKFHRLRQSLTADELILVEIDGKCKLVPIGSFVDEYVDDEGDVDVSGSDIRVPCFDRKTRKYSFRKVSHLIKHRRRNEIVRIRTLYNKEIKVTGCHSLFTLDRETMEVSEAAARDLEKGDLLVVPKKLPEPSGKSDICLLDYVSERAAKKQFWYLYLPRKYVKKIFSKSSKIHKKDPVGRPRKYYRFFRSGRSVDVVDDSYKMYVEKGFVPVWLAKFLMGAEILNRSWLHEASVRSYYHGKPYDIQAVWPVTSLLMKFLGIFVAEGHTGKRQVGLTVGIKERELVRLALDFAVKYGINSTVVRRPENNTIRVKLFGGFLSRVLMSWCGHRAENKHIPDFTFHTNAELRQHFIDYLYAGDGHNTPGRNQLMHTTVSERLADELSYLWLMQGVQASVSKKRGGGYSKKGLPAFTTIVYGKDIDKSFLFSPNLTSGRKRKRKTNYPNARSWAQKHGLGYKKEDFGHYESILSLGTNFSYKEASGATGNPKPGYKLRNLAEQGYIYEDNGRFVLTKSGLMARKAIKNLRKLERSDLAVVEIVEKDVVDGEYEYVYDVSVPGGENFVGGRGGVSCHNSRGQQGIGISAVVLYSQLTTGNPTKVWSRPGDGKTHYYEIFIDTMKNEPEIVKEDTKNSSKGTGLKVQMEMVGRYRKTQSVDDYLKQTSIVNPFAKMKYKAPGGRRVTFPRSVDSLPREPREMKLHPYGVEFGILLRMLARTKSHKLTSFLKNEFSSIGAKTAKDIVKKSGLRAKNSPGGLTRDQIEKLLNAMQEVQVQRPPLDCLSPIGEKALEKSLKKEYPDVEFITAVTRDPAVYRGNPFQIEVGIVYGVGKQDEPVDLLRFGNRVPLMYQSGACATSEALKNTDWKRYRLNQSGNTPMGPATVLIHMSSVWVPFISESKEAIAPYPDIVKEMKLALQDAGRQLSRYLSGKRKAGEARRRLKMFDRYASEVSWALSVLTEKKGKDVENSLRSLVRQRIKIKEPAEEGGEKKSGSK